VRQSSSPRWWAAVEGRAGHPEPQFSLGPSRGPRINSHIFCTFGKCPRVVAPIGLRVS